MEAERASGTMDTVRKNDGFLFRCRNKFKSALFYKELIGPLLSAWTNPTKEEWQTISLIRIAELNINTVSKGWT